MSNRELKAARVRAGKTQQECADTIGISRIRYAQKESMPSGFSVKQAEQLACLLQITKDDFFKVFFASDIYTNDNKEVTA